MRGLDKASLAWDRNGSNGPKLFSFKEWQVCGLSAAHYWLFLLYFFRLSHSTEGAAWLKHSLQGLYLRSLSFRIHKYKITLKFNLGEMLKAKEGEKIDSQIDDFSLDSFHIKGNFLEGSGKKDNHWRLKAWLSLEIISGFEGIFQILYVCLVRLLIWARCHGRVGG